MLDSLTGIQLQLKFGKSSRSLKSAPYEVITALTSVQVVVYAKERDTLH